MLGWSHFIEYEIEALAFETFIQQNEMHGLRSMSEVSECKTNEGVSELSELIDGVRG